MRLAKYLPPFISEIEEYVQIDNTNSIELDLLDSQLNQMLDNQFVNFANESALDRYEDMYNVPAVDNIDTRRFNIISRLNNTVPYTYRWLEQLLDSSLGRGNYSITLEPRTYFLHIGMTDENQGLIDPLVIEIQNKIPANIRLVVDRTLVRTFYLDGSRLLDGNTLLEGTDSAALANVINLKEDYNV